MESTPTKKGKLSVVPVNIGIVDVDALFFISIINWSANLCVSRIHAIEHTLHTSEYTGQASQTRVGSHMYNW